MDALYLLIGFVLTEIFLLACGFIALIRTMKRMIPEAEAMVARQKTAFKAEFRALLSEAKEGLKSSLDEVLNADTVKQMAADASEVVGAKLSEKFGGIAKGAITGYTKKAKSDPFGTVIELFAMKAMQSMSQIPGAGESPVPTGAPSLSPGIPWGP